MKMRKHTKQRIRKGCEMERENITKRTKCRRSTKGKKKHETQEVDEEKYSRVMNI